MHVACCPVPGMVLIYNNLEHLHIIALCFQVRCQGQSTTSRHITSYHSTAKHSTAQDSTAQRSATQRSAAQRSTVQHSTAHGSTAQYSTAHHSVSHDRTDDYDQYSYVFRICCLIWILKALQ